jgi:hypothetical protein
MAGSPECSLVLQVLRPVAPKLERGIHQCGAAHLHPIKAGSARWHLNNFELEVEVFLRKRGKSNQPKFQMAARGRDTFTGPVRNMSIKVVEVHCNSKLRTVG